MSDKQPEALQDPQMQMWLEYCAMKEEVARLHEVNAELVEALWELVKWYGARDDDDVLLPDRNQNPEICQAIQALDKAQGDNNG